MSCLVFGKTGQLARELAADPGVICLGREEADLSDPQACAKAISDRRPAMVINAAAYTAVDRAEEEEALATVINGDSPGAMASACAALGVPFVSVSTDYVFDGAGKLPRATTEPTGPLGAYGRSKLVGEQAIAEAGGVHAILRTSWVVSAHGNNFVKTMLRLGAERDGLNIVGDQIGGPTAASDIARACLNIAGQLAENVEKTGIYHFSGGPDVSWANFARTIFEKAGLDCRVSDIPSTEYPTPATRPLNSRLDNSLTEITFGITRPDWRVALDQIISDIRTRTV